MSTNLNPNEWISQAEAARLRGVSRQAIAKLIKGNRLKFLEVGGHILISREDVLKFEPKKSGRPKRHG